MLSNAIGIGLYCTYLLEIGVARHSNSVKLDLLTSFLPKTKFEHSTSCHVSLSLCCFLIEISLYHIYCRVVFVKTLWSKCLASGSGI